MNVPAQSGKQQIEKEWYLPAGIHAGASSTGDEEAVGPYPTPVVIEMLRNGHLRMDSFVWGPHLAEHRWYRFFELDEFSAYLVEYPRTPVPKKVSRGLSHQGTVHLKLSGKGEYGDQNRYRRFPRAPFDGSVIIHNQKHYFRARSIDISEKGIFLRVDRDMGFRVGEEVVATIRDFPGFGTISMHSVIIRVVKRDGGHGYGLYFLRVNPHIRRRIAQYVLHELGGDEWQQCA